MVLNEYGLNFIEIPFSGGDIFVKIFKETNRDEDVDDELVEKSIEYHNISIVQNPYQRVYPFTNMDCNFAKRTI